MDMKTLVARIDERLSALGLSAAEASKRATGSADTIRNWKRAAERGDNRTGATVRTLEPVAQVLQTNVAWLTGESSEASMVAGLPGAVALAPHPLRFGGEVRAGGFFAVDEYFSQDNIDFAVPTSVVRNPAFPQVQQFAWLVHGDSMGLAGITDGMWVVAAPFLEYRDKVGELFNGQPVIVERTRFGGSEIERTIKEFQFTRGGMRLIPRSANPAHKELFIPDDDTADNDTEEVKILAVVLSAVRDFSKPSF